MVVEPESLCWLTGRMVQARDGATWAEEFARYPALKAVVRDDGTGLGKGVRLERARRRAAGPPALGPAPAPRRRAPPRLFPPRRGGRGAEGAGRGPPPPRPGARRRGPEGVRPSR